MHPSNGEGYKHSNKVYPQFIIDSRNVHRRYIDEFNQFMSFAALYSCWPVILAVYNLSPKMRMRLEFMFVSMIISSPNSLGRNIDVYFISGGK